MRSRVGWRTVAIAIASVVAGSCQSAVSPEAYLPPQLEGSVVGRIAEVREGLSSLPHGWLDVLVEKLPVPTSRSCPATFFSVRPETGISRWQRTDRIGAGTSADLEVGALVRVFAREEVPCFGSCPGGCAAKSVDVFVR